MVKLGRVLVDRCEHGRVRGNTWLLRFHIGLIDGDLGAVDRLRFSHAILDAGTPVLGVHRLAFPKSGNGKIKAHWPCSDNAVYVTADAPTGDGEAELPAVGSVALLGVKIETRTAQPADGKLLQLVTNGENAQNLP